MLPIDMVTPNTPRKLRLMAGDFGLRHHHDDSSEQPGHIANTVIELVYTETVIVAAHSDFGGKAGTDCEHRDRNDGGRER